MESRTILTGSEIRGITALDVALTFNTPLSDLKVGLWNTVTQS